MGPGCSDSPGAVPPLRRVGVRSRTGPTFVKRRPCAASDTGRPPAGPARRLQLVRSLRNVSSVSKGCDRNASRTRLQRQPSETHSLGSRVPPASALPRRSLRLLLVERLLDCTLRCALTLRARELDHTLPPPANPGRLGRPTADAPVEGEHRPASRARVRSRPVGSPYSRGARRGFAASSGRTPPGGRDTQLSSTFCMCTHRLRWSIHRRWPPGAVRGGGGRSPDAAPAVHANRSLIPVRKPRF
jgi:hypothetical protein